jgi:hypothetical protein
MKICDDACLINALHVVEIAISNTTPYVGGKGTIMTATYALAIGDPKSQKIQSTHGKCSATPQNWSEETLKILADLIDSMEHDLLPRHFDTSTQLEKETQNDETGTEIGRHEETPQI